jgi:hypothetical protein
MGGVNWLVIQGGHFLQRHTCTNKTDGKVSVSLQTRLSEIKLALESLSGIVHVSITQEYAANSYLL